MFHKYSYTLLTFKVCNDHLMLYYVSEIFCQTVKEVFILYMDGILDRK